MDGRCTGFGYDQTSAVRAFLQLAGRRFWLSSEIFGLNIRYHLQCSASLSDMLHLASASELPGYTRVVRQSNILAGRINTPDAMEKARHIQPH